MAAPIVLALGVAGFTLSQAEIDRVRKEAKVREEVEYAISEGKEATGGRAIERVGTGQYL